MHSARRRAFSTAKRLSKCGYFIVQLSPLGDLTSCAIKFRLFRLGVAAQVNGFSLWKPVIRAPSLTPKPGLVERMNRQNILY